ncbi:MAG: hypothetical protein HW419_1179 [Deltaproteobacteria bacterium]|nr:hypothetical protein [Deltaproteobacteria bacterium]
MIEKIPFMQLVEACSAFFQEPVSRCHVERSETSRILNFCDRLMDR